jgi:hypothetical protein
MESQPASQDALVDDLRKQLGILHTQLAGALQSLASVQAQLEESRAAQVKAEVWREQFKDAEKLAADRGEEFGPLQAGA